MVEDRPAKVATTPTGSVMVTAVPFTAYPESAALRAMASSAASSSGDGVTVSTVVPLDPPSAMVTLCVPVTL